jgi:hypothetical protein
MVTPKAKRFAFLKMSNSNMADGGFSELVFRLGERPPPPPTKKLRQNSGEIIPDRS